MEALGPVLIVLAIPLILRWVPPNPLYGFRVPATLKNRPLWYKVNALAGWHFIALGVLMVALEFAVPVAFKHRVLTAIGALGLAIIISADWRTANRWRRERERPHSGRR